MLNHDLILLSLINASQGHHEDPFNWFFVLEHAVNLALLLGLLVYLTKKPFLLFLKKRKETITSEINDAKKAIEEAALKHKEYSAKFKSLESEINSLKENIKKQGQLEKEELIKQAQKSCELIKKEVVNTVALETAKAKQELQSEVVSSSMELAEKLIKENLQSSFTKNAIDKLVKIIEDEKWQQLQH
ncbi:MAG: ATP synthase F0 subunit B [Thermodesulfobacteriota bacterium]